MQVHADVRDNVQFPFFFAKITYYLSEFAILPTFSVSRTVVTIEVVAKITLEEHACNG